MNNEISIKIWKFPFNNISDNVRCNMPDGSTHCCLVTPCGVTELGQHWFRQWLGAISHQAITQINVNLSLMRPVDICLKAISDRLFNINLNTKVFENYIFENSATSSRGNELKCYLISYVNFTKNMSMNDSPDTIGYPITWFHCIVRPAKLWTR